MNRAIAGQKADEIRALGPDARPHHTGPGGYVVLVRSADGTPGTVLEDEDACDRLIAGLKKRTRRQEATRGS